MTPQEQARRSLLEAAGHNLFRIAPAHIPYDLFSDVPHHVRVPAEARDASDADPDAVRAALRPLTGDAELALATKGRAAENALVDALELDGPPVVLTHGLFATTQTALARRGAVLEELPMVGDGSCDVDLDHLEARLAKKAHLVYLELANNATFGWPLRAANLAAVRAACDRHGARLLVDATRPLSNAVAQEARDVVGCAREMLAQAHAFTMSCAKELLVPGGAIVGSTDAAMIARASQLVFRSGTSMTTIDPPSPRAELRDGARHALAHTTLIADRLAVVRGLAAALGARGVTTVAPVTAHAVYVPLPAGTVPHGDVGAMIAALSHLFAIAGVRAQLATTKRGTMLRLAIPLATPYKTSDLDEIASGVAMFVDRLDERVALRIRDREVEVPYFRRFDR